MNPLQDIESASKNRRDLLLYLLKFKKTHPNQPAILLQITEKLHIPYSGAFQLYQELAIHHDLPLIMDWEYNLPKVVRRKPQGTIQKSKFDKDVEQIKEFLKLGLSVRKISKFLGYPNHQALNNYINKRLR